MKYVWRLKLPCSRKKQVPHFWTRVFSQSIIIPLWYNLIRFLQLSNETEHARTLEFCCLATPLMMITGPLNHDERLKLVSSNTKLKRQELMHVSGTCSVYCWYGKPFTFDLSWQVPLWLPVLQQLLLQTWLKKKNRTKKTVNQVIRHS